jgi:hypothetical protein
MEWPYTADDLRHAVVSLPASSLDCCRIVGHRYRHLPLGFSPVGGRFGDPNRVFRTGYFARQEASAIHEVLIRDYFKQGRPRVIHRRDLRTRLFLYFEQIDEMTMLDTTGGLLNATDVSEDVRHGKTHSESQQLAAFAYHQLGVDGILYRSYYHGGLCIAIFDRSAKKLRYKGRKHRISLDRNQLTISTLDRVRVIVSNA